MAEQFGEIGKLSKSAQIAALFQDFEAPLYNVWTRRWPRRYEPLSSGRAAADLVGPSANEKPVRSRDTIGYTERPLTTPAARDYSVSMATADERRESNRIRTARARANRRSRGLCLDCAAPSAIEDGQRRARCPIHLQRAARWQLEARGGVRDPERLTRAT